MQKKLIAAAIAAVASTGAFAQVTMYGILDAGVAMYSGDAGATKNSNSVVKMETGNINGNRIGFKGEEDLGDGMKGYAQAEFGFGQDTSTGLNSNRQTFVGLSGAFGAITLGRQYTPMFNVVAAVDPYGTSGLGAVGSATLYSATANPSVGLSAAKSYLDLYAVRADNAVQYSKSFGPVTVQAQVGFGETDGNKDANRVDGLAVIFNQGPVLAGFAYQAQNVTATSTNVDITRMIAGGTYTLPVAKLSLALGKLSYDDTLSNTTTDGDFTHLGATVPVGKGNILLAINKVGVEDSDFTQFGVAYHHNFGKRTIGYVQYGSVDSDDFDVQLLKSGHGQGFVAGLRHAF